MENRTTVGLVVVAAVVGAGSQPEDCRLLVLLEALAEVMGRLVIKGIHMLDQQQILLKNRTIGQGQ